MLKHNREKFFPSKNHQPSLRTQQYSQTRQKSTLYEPIAKAPATQTLSPIELTRYDQLKKTAEQLIQSQLATQTEHDMARTKVHDLEKQVQIQVNKIHKLRKDKSQLATMLNAEKTTLEKLCFEVKTLQTLSQSFQTELTDMRSKIKKSDHDKQDLKCSLDECTQKISELSITAERAESLKAIAEKECLELRDQIQSFQRLSSEHEDELKRNACTIEEIQLQNKELMNEVEMLKLAITKKSEIVDELTDSLAEKDGEYSKMKGTLNLELISAKEMIDKSSNLVEEYQNKNVELNNQLAESLSIRNSLETRIDNQILDIERLVNCEIELRSMLDKKSKDYESELSKLRKQIQTLESKNAEVLTTMEIYKEDKNQEEAKNRSLQDDLKKFKTTIDNQKLEIQSLSSLKSNIAELKRNCKESLDKKEIELMKLTSCIEDREIEISKLNHEISLLNDKMHKVNSEFTSLKEENHCLNEANVELEKQVKELNIMNKSLDKSLKIEQKKLSEARIVTEELRNSLKCIEYKDSIVETDYKSSQKKYKKDDTFPQKNSQNTPQNSKKKESLSQDDQMEVEVPSKKHVVKEILSQKKIEREDVSPPPMKQKSYTLSKQKSQPPSQKSQKYELFSQDDQMEAELAFNVEGELYQKKDKREISPKKSEGSKIDKDKRSLTPKMRRKKSSLDNPKSKSDTKTSSHSRMSRPLNKSKTIKKKSDPDMFTVANVFDFSG